MSWQRYIVVIVWRSIFWPFECCVYIVSFCLALATPLYFLAWAPELIKEMANGARPPTGMEAMAGGSYILFFYMGVPAIVALIWLLATIIPIELNNRIDPELKIDFYELKVSWKGHPIREQFTRARDQRKVRKQKE